MSSIRCLNFEFLSLKLDIKNMFMDRIVNNIRLIGMKFDMCFKNIKNMQFNGYIFKICNHINLFSKSCSLCLQLSLGYK